MSTIPDCGLPAPEPLPSDEQKWLEFQVRVQKSRALVYSAGIAVACLAKVLGEFDLSWWVVAAYVCAADGSSLLFGLAFKRGLRRILGVSLQALWMGSDVVLIAWMIHLTGGSQSYWFPWALANVAAAAFVIGRRGIVVIMAANTVVYLAMALIFEQPSLRTLIILTLRLLILYAAAFFALIGISNLLARRRVISSHRSQEMRRAAELAESEERHRAPFQSGASPCFVFDRVLPGRAATAKPEPEVVPRGRGRVLVMDDEPELREMYEDVLSELGYEAETVADGGAAVRRYEEACESDRPFDCIIMDLTVPGRMGGKEALAALKLSDPDVIAIVASGYSKDCVLVDYRAEGFAAALAKPFTISELARTLDHLLHTRRAAPG